MATSSSASDEVTRRMSTEQVTEFIWDSLEENVTNSVSRSTRSSNQSPLTRSSSKVLPIVIVSIALIGCGLLAWYMWPSAEEEGGDGATGEAKKKKKRSGHHHSHAHHNGCGAGARSTDGQDATTLKKRGSSVECTCECTCGADDGDILEELRNEVIEENASLGQILESDDVNDATSAR